VLQHFNFRFINNDPYRIYYSMLTKSLPVYEMSYNDNPKGNMNGTGAILKLYIRRYFWNFEKDDSYNFLVTCDRYLEKSQSSQSKLEIFDLFKILVLSMSDEL
jgi:hypothetical protein